VDADTIKSVFDKYLDTGYSPNGWTNWQDALIKSKDTSGDGPHADLVVFVTDGDPTAFNDPPNAPKTNQSNAASLEKAIPEANKIKRDDTKIFGVGVGSALNNSSSQDRLKKISGPNVATGDDVSNADVIFVQDFGALAAKLTSIAKAMCGSSVTITKKVDSDGDGQFDDDPSGWTITGTLSAPSHTWVQPDNATGDQAVEQTNADGYATFKWNAGQATASFSFQETLKDDFRMVGVGCSPSGNFTAGDGGGSITGIGPEDNVTCTIRNATTRIAVCHWTGREYQQQHASVQADGSLDPDHFAHPRDIIPPYAYLSPNGPTEEHASPGQNWDQAGQDRWQNGCVGGDVPPPDQPIIPKLRCVEEVDGGGLLAHFGYTNPADETVTIPLGPQNELRKVPGGEPFVVDQPTEFAPGPHLDVFQAEFPADVGVAWTLDGTTVTANKDSDECEASITIVKSLVPAKDHGKFDLEINGQVRGTGAAVGNGGTTGTVAVAAGRTHQVGESGAKGTKLANYRISIVCRNGTVVVAQGATQPVPVKVADGQAIKCTITNTRRGSGPTPPTPTPPTPTPPTPPAPPPAPPPPDPETEPVRPGLVDLSVVKTAKPTATTLGGKLSWLITVKNKSDKTATNVVVEDIAGKLGLGSAFVSVSSSQGTCNRTGCILGTLGPGRSATIRVVSKALKVGTITNTVRVSADQPDANIADNTDSALVRVGVALGKVAVAIRCGSLTLTPNRLIAGEPQIVYATVKDRRGKPIPGAPIRARGIGSTKVANTNERGIARFTLGARKGIVGFAVIGTRLTLPDPRRCTSLLAVRSAKAPPSFTG
jgi:uncharacterized repeat protein (TIGR01451 family)